MDLIPARWRALVLGSALVGIIILCFGYLSEDEGTDNDDGAVIPLLIVVIVSIIVAYLLWRYLVATRAAGSAAMPALVVGIVSLLLAFFYWTGLVYFVAPVGIALGASAGGDQRGRIGLILSAVALGAAVAIGLADAVIG